MKKKFTFRIPLMSQYRELFFDRDPESRGRLCMLVSSIVASIASNLSGGAFYSAFLLEYGINLTNIGIIIFIPYIASLFTALSPSVLSHFKKRRFVLLFSRIAYYTISIIGVTVMPMIVKGETAKVVWFALLMFIANVINFIFGPGYSVWHFNFLPDRVRSGYFTQSQFMTALASGVLVVLVSIGADVFSGTPQERTVIIIVRLAAYVFALADCVVLALPKEYPYAVSKKRASIADVVCAPLKNRMFLGAIGLYCGYCIYVNLSGSVLNAYLLSDTRVSYTMIYGINALYAPFFIVFSGFWQKLIRRRGWVPVFAIASLMLAATNFLHMFIDYQNSIWLYPTVRIMQHFIGIGQNVTAANLHLLYMPEADRDNFVSFYQLSANMANFVAMMLGTGFVALMGDSTLTVLGHTFTSVPLLMGLHGVACVAVSFLARRFHKAELRLVQSEN